METEPTQQGQLEQSAGSYGGGNSCLYFVSIATISDGVLEHTSPMEERI
jgi:hypothetical protein